MKIKASYILFFVVLAASIFFLGCQEQSLTSQRRYRLVGDENLKLKEQLKLRDNQIAKLEEVIAEYENEEQKRADVEKKSGEMVISLLKDNDTLRKKNDKLTDENTQLKVRINELESELAVSVDSEESL
jgi:Spy/CpxP family protein refolding chaperone